MPDAFDSNNIIQIGEFRYQFNLFLFNDQKQFLPLNRAAIRQLTITDSIFNPFHTATLYLIADQQLFERTDFNYTFLGNGRDIVYVELMQALSDNNSDFTDEKKRKLFALNFAFVVVECNDVDINNFTCIELRMVQYEQYMLNETNVKSLSKPNAINANNQDRTESTGNLIQKILTDVFENTYQTNNKQLIYKDNFDEGKNGIMLIPQGNYSNMNAINSILYQHQSKENNDWCILSCERYTKTFSLRSLADIFKNHNELVLETLNLKQLVADESDSSGGTSIGALKWSPNFFGFNDLSDIVSFYTDYSDAQSIINLQSNIITSSDAKPDKAFILNITQGFSNEILQEYSKLYVEPFKDLFGKKLIPTIKLTNLQKNGAATKHETSSTPADISKYTTAIQKYTAMLFMDRVNIIYTKGLTSRKSGHFIDITTETNELKTVWDYRNIGRHFITSIEHTFTQDTYTNKIETIKPYAVDYKTSN